MSIIKNNQTAINPKNGKTIPIWKLDTETITVYNFNEVTQTVEQKTFHTDFIRYHIHYSESKCPDRLRKLVNDGTIISYLDDLEITVNKALAQQVQIWKDKDQEYQTAVAVGDTEKQIGLENCFLFMARESVFACLVYC